MEVCIKNNLLEIRKKSGSDDQSEELQITNSKIAESKLVEFYKKCSSLEKYLDIVKLWDDIHINEEKAYSDIDKVIRNRAYVEKLDGSRSEDVKKQLVKWANGDWS